MIALFGVLFAIAFFLCVFGFFILLPTFMFWVAWTWYGVGATYFSFLPEQFHIIPFWDVFFILMAIGTLAGSINGSYAKQLNRLEDKFNSKKET